MTVAVESFICRYLLQPLTIEDHKAKAANQAAVLIPLIETSQGYEVLLTKRAQHLRHHPGQISFPGGRKDPDDKSLLETAVRECYEETGLSAERILGNLPRYVTNTGFVITPYIGIVDSIEELSLSKDEVEEAFRIPLNHLLNSENHISFSVKRKKRELSLYWISLPNQNEYIWGATAGILHNLFCHIHGIRARSERYL